MPSVDELIAAMRANPKGVRFADLRKVCDAFFEARPTGHGSHRSYKTPWHGDPRVNIQNEHGSAKPYQVRQVLMAIDRLAHERQGGDGT